MHELYDVGYQSIKNSGVLIQLAEKMGAVVYDIRFSPKSSDPQWAGINLEITLGGRYIHLKELGNKNYKGGPIELVDQSAGLEAVYSELQNRPVILMCGCWDREKCHRKTAARLFELRYGVVSIPLTSPKIKEILGMVDPPEIKQDSLF
ncbi:hypothetical protein ADN00_15790 [Ornatilinea apprima]|uniref:DUF488 domain-containing protein n=1 Tax=Ornatilinea apprima TaxID=1134406 RepID=A0A0P6XBW6_9CHLR|nr:DUF488 domain-containing protein [Ornatilinea apprima]KPL72275.1 hypothetical protein ADN00_15790 [Ornatilinea apprima]